MEYNFRMKEVRKLKERGYDILKPEELQAKIEGDWTEVLLNLGYVGGGFESEDALYEYVDEVGLNQFQEEVMEAYQRDYPLVLTGRKNQQVDPQEPQTEAQEPTSAGTK